MGRLGINKLELELSVLILTKAVLEDQQHGDLRFLERLDEKIKEIKTKKGDYDEMASDRDGDRR